MHLAASVRSGLLALFLLVGTASAQTVREQLKRPEFCLYSVIFGVTIGADAKLQSFRVSKVIEPKTGTTDAVEVPVPPEYVEAARRKFEAQPHEPKLENGQPVEFFTYFFHSPARPATAITDLDQPIDQQP